MYKYVLLLFRKQILLKKNKKMTALPPVSIITLSCVQPNAEKVKNVKIVKS